MTAKAEGCLTLHWPELANEHGAPMLWFASWLVGNEGCEGDWVYSGRGGESALAAVPADATGVRIRRWPSEGLEPEYVDVDLAATQGGELRVGGLDFDTVQRFSRLPKRPELARRGVDP